MKLTVAAIALTSISASAEFLPDPAGQLVHNVVEDSSRARHRILAVAMERQREVTALMSDRRASKRKNGRSIRSIQNKLKNSELRNKAGDSDKSATDNELDLGFFSRKMQFEIDPNRDENTHIDDLLDICARGTDENGLTCTCSNFDRDNYSIDVFCSYDENTCYSKESSCGGNETICYSTTYDVEITNVENRSNQICYEMSEPFKQNYCRTIQYDGLQNTVIGCTISFDGKECNSCEYNDDSSCKIYDCTNIDNDVGEGSHCGDDPYILESFIDEHLRYGVLPCEYGCNICPGNGKMTNLNINVSLETGEEYTCRELNLAAQLGYFQYIAGDLCNSLPARVNEPCGCTSGDQTSVALDSEDGPVTNSPLDDSGKDRASSTSSASISSFIGGFAISAAVTSIFSWTMA